MGAISRQNSHSRVLMMGNELPSRLSNDLPCRLLSMKNLLCISQATCISTNWCQMSNFTEPSTRDSSVPCYSFWDIWLDLFFSFQISRYTNIYKHMSDIFSLLNVPELVEIWIFFFNKSCPTSAIKMFSKELTCRNCPWDILDPGQ